MKTCKCGNNLFTVEEKIFPNNIKQVGAYCSACKAWLQWLPTPISNSQGLTQVGDIEIPFGKFKGTKLKDLGRDYLQWGAETFDNKWKDKFLAVLKEQDERSND